MVDVKRILINGMESKYTVDTLGRIYSDVTDRYLKPFLNPQGYALVDLHHNKISYTRQVHRLVAIAFIPNPEGLPTVNHKNGVKTDHFVDNLEWMSQKDNVRHAWSTGLAKPRFGINNPANVYTEDQIHEVCSLLETRQLSIPEIAQKCNVNTTLIRDIKFRGKWKHISSQYDIPRVPIRYEHMQNDIIELMKNGYRDKDIFTLLELPDTRLARQCVKYCRAMYNYSLNDYPCDGSTPISK